METVPDPIEPTSQGRGFWRGCWRVLKFVGSWFLTLGKIATLIR